MTSTPRTLPECPLRDLARAQSSAEKRLTVLSKPAETKNVPELRGWGVGGASLAEKESESSFEERERESGALVRGPAGGGGGSGIYSEQNCELG